jgi:hypothetical protein
MLFVEIFVLLFYLSSGLSVNEIIILAYNRPESLQRCLGSLSRANYLGKRVNLTIYIDGPLSNLTIENLKIGSRWEWSYGSKRIFQRSRNYGVFGQWFNSLENSSSALVIEDDVVVSSEFYRAISAVLPRINDSFIYGIAFQRAQWQLGITEKGSFRRLDLVDSTHFPFIFGYPAVGTWGQVIFPRHFANFKAWYSLVPKKQKIDGLIHEKWRSERRGDIWSYWFTRYALEHNLYNAYFNFPNGEALSTSYREFGKYLGKTKGPQDSLVKYFNEELLMPVEIRLFDECLGEVKGPPSYDYWEGERERCRLDRSELICKAIRCFYKPGRYPHHKQDS